MMVIICKKFFTNYASRWPNKTNRSNQNELIMKKLSVFIWYLQITG